MRLLTIMVLVAIMHVNANTLAQGIDFQYTNVTLEEAFVHLQKRSGYDFLYDSSLIKKANRVTISANNADITEVMDKLLANQPLTYVINKKTITIKAKPQPTFVTIKGKVTDDTNEPLSGVNISVKNTQSKTVSDDKGQYSIEVKDQNAVLVFSYVGFLSQERQVGNSQIIDVRLSKKTAELDEVVVNVGFSTQKKVNLTGAVGTADMKQMENRPVRNAAQMLQGLVPGLNVNQAAGGSLDVNPTINIRGVGTIGQGSSSDPLVLIDGMQGDINSINPQDIESISVLKDASTSSIYGSRAAFGVILITTKSGKSGKTKISYNNNLRANNPINIPNMVDSYQFALYFNDAGINSGQTPHFAEWRLNRIQDFMSGKIDYSLHPSNANPTLWAPAYDEGYANTDWYEEMYNKNTFSQEHNLNISGGDKLRYFVSGNYLDQGGLVRHNKDRYKRYTSSMKLNGELNDWIEGTFSFRYIHEDHVKPYYLNETFFYDLARQGWPVLPVYDPNGYMLSAPSPALNVRDGGNVNKQTDWIYQQGQIVLEPIKNWKTFAELNFRQRIDLNKTVQQMTYNHNVNGEPLIAQTSSHVNQVNNRTYFINTNVYSEYRTRFAESHNMKFILGYQSELNKSINSRAMRDGLILPSLPVLDLTSGNGYNGTAVMPTITGNDNHWATAGFFGRVNYDFDERYLFEANLRYDGTSRYRGQNRWNWFPSFSAGWNISKENFFQPFQSSFDLFKVRGSYGSLGNQNTSNLYPTYVQMPYTSNSGAWLIGGMKPNVSNAPGIVSSSLTWERIYNWNMGLDFALLRNRLDGSFDYFNRKTLNMIGPAPELPVVLGTEVPKMNNTDLETTGWEFSVAWRDKVGEINYNARLNLSDSKTRITNYPNKTGSIYDASGNLMYRSDMLLGEIWGYETLGIARSQEEMDRHLISLGNGGQNALVSAPGYWGAGDIMYRDLNGDGKIDAGESTISNSGDLRIIGNSSARYAFSFDLGVDWKGFSLNTLFQGVMRREVFLNSYYFWGMGRGIWWATAFEEHMNYFREDPNHPLGQNLDSYYPRPLTVDAAKNQKPQTKYLLDASYLRLKNIQVAYAMPDRFLNNLKLANLKLYFSGENLWTATRIDNVFDPETIDGRADGAVVYPLFKVYSAGLSVNF